MSLADELGGGGMSLADELGGGGMSLADELGGGGASLADELGGVSLADEMLVGTTAGKAISPSDSQQYKRSAFWEESD